LGGGFVILMFLVTLGQHIFLLGRENRILLDLGQVAVEALLSAARRDLLCLGSAHV